MDKQSSKSVSDLSYSESRLKAILETVVDGIVTINSKGVIETVNPAAENIFGYLAGEMIGKNVKMLMPDSYAREHDSYLNNYLKTGEKKIIGIGREVTGKRKDGSNFPMNLAVSEMDIDGEQMFTGIVRDISERKQHEADIHAREQRIRTLVETIPDGIIVINEEGLIETFNPAAEMIFGYERDEVLFRNIKILMPPPYSNTHDAHISRFLHTGQSKIFGLVRELEGKRKDGAIFPMELTISEMWVNESRLFNGIIRDISDRKAAELAETKKKALEITAAFERTQSQVMVLFSKSFDAAAVFESILDLLAREHNFPVSAVYLFDDWKGTLDCVAYHGLPENFNRQLNPDNGLIGQVAKTGKTCFVSSGEEMPFHIDTGLFPIEPQSVVIAPISYSEKVLGVIALAKTEHMEQSELAFITRLSDQVGVSLNNLNQYHNMKILSEQLRQRGQEISQKNVLLEKANLLKTEFLANMSHELRTPLNAIIGFSEVIKDKMLGELNEEQDDYIGEILGSANHLLSLINDILDLSKVEAGKMELYPEPFNLDEVFRNSVSIIKEQAHASKIKISVKVHDNVDAILVGDQRKLKQILFNLLSNAVKFTPQGGSVTLEAFRLDTEFHVKVTDTGIGISEENIQTLFRPFEQLDSSLARQYGGTGLGLSLVKRLVELHGGKVGVDSVENKGSCFYFSIPYKTPEDYEDFSEASKKNTAVRFEKSSQSLVEGIDHTLEKMEEHFREENGKQINAKDVLRSRKYGDRKYRILVIEDNVNQLELLRLYLEEAGYEVCLALDGSEGIECLETFNPDLITLDLLMPGMDGFAFLEVKNKMPAFSKIPVIVLSIVSHWMEDSALAADAILNKPISRSEVLGFIEKLLPKRQHQMQKIKPKLLLIDDDPKAIKIINSYLPSKEYEVLSAFNGVDGIELAKIERPDLIILDLMMPEFSGFEVLKSLKHDHSSKDIPVLILTAKMLSNEERQDLLGQVEAIASKGSADSTILVDEIGKILRRYKKL